MASQINLTISLVLIGLFAIALISFAINFAIDNDTDTTIADDDTFSSLNNNLRSNVNTFQDDSNTSTQAIQKTTLNADSGEAEGGTAFKVGPVSALGMLYKTLKASYIKLFGADENGNQFLVLLTAFISTIAIVSGWLILKAWKGNP